MSEWEELVGADFAEHGFRRVGAGITRAVSVLGHDHHGFDYSTIPPQGDNPSKYIGIFYSILDFEDNFF